MHAHRSAPGTCFTSARFISCRSADYSTALRVTLVAVHARNASGSVTSSRIRVVKVQCTVSVMSATVGGRPDGTGPDVTARSGRPSALPHEPYDVVAHVR